MSQVLLAPMIVALAAALLSGIARRNVRPRLVTWSLTVTSVAVAVASLSALVMVLVAFVHALGSPEAALAWCLQLGHHGTVPWLEASFAIGWLGVMAVRLQRCRHGYRSLVPAAHAHEVEILADRMPVAYTLPGRRGRIVISTGMLDALRDDERVVLLAHERSHRARRHDRFIYLVDLAVAVVPPLTRMRQLVRQSTERWADEDAAHEVGDRRLVARALIRAALVQASPQPGLAMASTGVRSRVDELLEEPASGLVAALAISLAVGLSVVAAASSSLQVHHLGIVISQLCGAQG